MTTSLIAHRGRHSPSHPENTVQSMTELPSQVTGVEIDVRLSSDDVPVLMHDATLDRTTDSSGAVDALTAAQLGDVWAGNDFVPTLAQYLAACEGRQWLWILLDMKIHTTAAFTATMAVVDSAPPDVRDACVVLTAEVSTFRAVSPDGRLGRLSLSNANVEDRIAEAIAENVELHLTVPNAYDVNRPAVFAVMAAGFFAGSSTNNDPQSMLQVARDDAAMVFTDIASQFPWWNAAHPPEQDLTGLVQDFAPIVAGSHRMLVEAIVVDGFQDGPNPTGTPLEVLGGDVSFDAAADIFATMELEVAGVDELGGSLFPRRATDLLAPYGREVYVRRGVDLGGGGQMWAPLGYFQIRAVEQDDSPYGSIRISGQDRMAGLAEARALTPREFGAERAVGSVVAEIVGEVYPQAVVTFDDPTAFEALGRSVVLEEDRVPVLRELADSFSKIVNWDGEGVLRFEAVPDITQHLIEISGVTTPRGSATLVESGRRVTRGGHNGVRAVGEGDEASGGVDQVMAVAVDIGPNSPTRWAPTSEGGYGFVPRFYASPLIRTLAQALSAARSILSRELGAPYSVDFGIAVNPALRPYHVVRITQQDGNRERHTVDRLSIPLDEAGVARGATREVTQAVIGALIS